MGHRNYHFQEMGDSNNSSSDIQDNTADIVAYKLFEKYGSKGIKSLHINSNIVTMELAEEKIEPAENLNAFRRAIFVLFASMI